MAEAIGSVISLVLAINPQTKMRPRFSRKTGRAYNHERYTAWKNNAAQQLREMWRKSDRTEPIAHIRKIAVQFYGSNAGAGDLEGLFGAIADALVDAQVLLDDRLNVFSHLETAWERCSKKDERIEIYLYF